ncbi:hypothetical protein LXL04_000751 [Taraxacum kok-saghyz]
MNHVVIRLICQGTYRIKPHDVRSYQFVSRRIARILLALILINDIIGIIVTILLALILINDIIGIIVTVRLCLCRFAKR